MKLENEFLLVEIAAQGAEVTRIFNKKDETDVLWEGNPVFWCRHSPLLFPYVGKTYQNKSVSYTHLTLPTTSRRQRQMCIRDRYKFI